MTIRERILTLLLLLCILIAQAQHNRLKEVLDVSNDWMKLYFDEAVENVFLRQKILDMKTAGW